MKISSRMVSPVPQAGTEQKKRRFRPNFFRVHLYGLFSVLITLFLLFSFSRSEAQTITVRDAVTTAMQRNPVIRQAEEEIRIQQAREEAAWGIENPEFYYLKDGIDAGSFLEKRWGISQKFAFPLTGYYRSRKERLEVASARKQLEWIRIDLRTSVKKTYAELAWSIQNLDLARQEVELTEELVLISRLRLAAGESTELDLIQVEMEHERARNRWKQAEQEWRNSTGRLMRVMGVRPEEWSREVFITDSLTYVAPPISREVLFQNVERLPGLQAVSLRENAARENVLAAKSAYLPDLRVDLYRQNMGNGFRYGGLEVGVSLPLWFWFNERSHSQQTRSQFRQVQWEVEEVRLTLYEEAGQAWNRYESSRQQLLSYRERIESRSAHLLDLTLEGYRSGELDLLRVLEAQRTYLNSRQDYFRTLRDAYLQLIELERFLPEEVVFVNGEADENPED